MQFIRFNQPDPHYGKSGLRSEVIVQVGQIVKIEPCWTQVTEDGQHWVRYVGPDDDSAALDEDTLRQYMLYDSLGNKYSSEEATEEGKQIIAELWKSAK